MAWDFSTDPEFERQLEWMRTFVREEVWPIEAIEDRLTQTDLDRINAPLQEEVKRRGLWAAHLPPVLGCQGFGQVKQLPGGGRFDDVPNHALATFGWKDMGGTQELGQPVDAPRGAGSDGGGRPEYDAAGERHPGRRDPGRASVFGRRAVMIPGLLLWNFISQTSMTVAREVAVVRRVESGGRAWPPGGCHQAQLPGLFLDRHARDQRVDERRRGRLAGRLEESPGRACKPRHDRSRAHQCGAPRDASVGGNDCLC